MFSVVLPDLLPLQSSHPSFHDAPRPMGKEYDMKVPIMAEPSIAIFSFVLWLVVNFNINHHTKKFLCWDIGAGLIYGQNHKFKEKLDATYISAK